MKQFPIYFLIDISDSMTKEPGEKIQKTISKDQFELNRTLG